MFCDDNNVTYRRKTLSCDDWSVPFSAKDTVNFIEKLSEKVLDTGLIDQPSSVWCLHEQAWPNKLQTYGCSKTEQVTNLVSGSYFTYVKCSISKLSRSCRAILFNKFAGPVFIRLYKYGNYTCRSIVVFTCA